MTTVEPEHPIPPVQTLPSPTPASASSGSSAGGARLALVADLIEADGVLVQQWLSAELLTRIG